MSRLNDLPHAVLQFYVTAPYPCSYLPDRMARSQVATPSHLINTELYGVAIGRAFFGESMFSRKTDASKVALVALVEELRRRNCPMIDCQQRTPLLASLGAREIPRRQFLRRLAALVN